MNKEFKKITKPRDKVNKALLFVLLSIFTGIIIIPFLLMISTSLKTPLELQAPTFNFIPEKFAFSNYVEAMNRGKWDIYFWNTFYVTTITVVFSLITNSLAGYSFARIHFRGREVLFGLALIGFMIPQQVTMIPIFVILRKFPLLGGNDILGNGGVGLFNSYWALILPYIAGSFGVFMFRQFFMNFPQSLDDAAKVDGLGRIKAFYYIYIPLSKPVFATLAALKATQTWNEYTWPLIITNQDKMKTVQLALTLFRSESEVKWHLLMAATTLISLPLILLFFAAQRYFIEGITTTGMKN